MRAVQILKNLEQVRTLADPLRLRVLYAFREAPRTTKQVALLLKEPSTKLYHHVDRLERTGLLRFVKTKQNRGTTEKYYRAVAENVIIGREILERTAERSKALTSYESVFMSGLKAGPAEARQGIAAGLIRPVHQGRNAALYRMNFWASDKHIRALMNAMKKWIRKHSSTSSGDVQYGLTVALYPISKRRFPAHLRKRRPTNR